MLLFRVFDEEGSRHDHCSYITNGKGFLIGNMKNMFYVPMSDIRSFEVPHRFYQGSANSICKRLNSLLKSGYFKFNDSVRVDFTHFVNPNNLKVVK